MIKDDLFKYEPTVMQSLTNALKSSRLAHTILLSGPKNPLKLKLAYLLSAVIVSCEKEFPDDDGNTLRRIMSDDYPDVIYVDGNKATIKKEDIEKAEAWFQKYGMLASFIGRNFPIVRTFISLPIGMMRLNFWPFVLYTTLGSIPWTFAFVYVGYSLGNNWVILQEYTSRLKVPLPCLRCLHRQP